MDVFGRAASDYLQGMHDDEIRVESSTMEDDIIPVAHLFRKFPEMPICEQVALDAVRGRVLDVGGGAGSHCLYLQNKKMHVTMLDYSSGLCKVAKSRGVKNVVEHDFFTWHTTERFDTILFMMNGIGIGGNFSSFQHVIERSFTLLNPGGQILFDSTDISFCYEQDDGSLILPMHIEYNGFVEFKLRYKHYEDKWFKWAYYDPEKLREILPSQYDFDILKKDGPAYCGKITQKQ